jgi:hypothetical protein
LFQLHHLLFYLFHLFLVHLSDASQAILSCNYTSFSCVSPSLNCFLNFSLLFLASFSVISPSLSVASRTSFSSLT